MPLLQNKPRKSIAGLLVPGGQNLEPYAAYPRKFADVPTFCHNFSSVDFVFEAIFDSALTKFLPGSAPNSIVMPRRGERLTDPCSVQGREFEVLVPISLATFPASARCAATPASRHPLPPASPLPPPLRLCLCLYPCLHHCLTLALSFLHRPLFLHAMRPDLAQTPPT